MQARRTLMRDAPSVTEMVSPSPTERTVEACAGATTNNRVVKIMDLVDFTSLPSTLPTIEHYIPLTSSQDYRLAREFSLELSCQVNWLKVHGRN